MFKVPEAKKKKFDTFENDQSDFDDSYLKKLLLSLDKNLQKNLEQREKFKDEPEKFMESEVELDEEIKKLQNLAASPHLYLKFSKLGGVSLLFTLLSHENIDIVSDTIEVIKELTEPDSVLENEESMVVIKTLLEENIIERISLLIQNNNQKSPEEEQLIHNCLEIIENLTEIDKSTFDKAEKTKIFEWILSRIEEKSFSSVSLYASEILSILASNSLIQKKLGNSEWMDKLILCLEFYRKEKPNGSDEIELMENIFDTLCSILLLPENQETFIKLEGIELLLILIQKRKFLRLSAIKALNFAVLNNPRACEVLIEKKGIAIIFPTFIEIKKEEDMEHMISLLVSLMNNIDKKRFINKFVENEFEKTDKLMDSFFYYRDKVTIFEKSVSDGILDKIYQDVDEDLIYIEKLNNGYSVLQNIVSILCVISENENIKKRILLQLDQRSMDVSSIEKILNEYQKHTDDEKILSLKF